MWHFTEYQHYPTLQQRLSKAISNLADPENRYSIYLDLDQPTAKFLKETRWRDVFTPERLHECLSGDFMHLSLYAKEVRLREAWLSMSSSEQEKNKWDDFYNSQLAIASLRPDLDDDDKYERFKMPFEIPGVRLYERYVRPLLVQHAQLNYGDPTQIKGSVINMIITDVIMVEWIQLFLRRDVLGDMSAFLGGKSPADRN